MIRREIALPDGTRLWLLISQVEHARISGELAENWHEPLADEAVAAIAHHDDGWAAWEAEPKMNPEVGAPFSFLEMPIAAALVIWDHSIASAEKFGPLAAFMVAGHFYNLLNNSDNANDPLANAWLTAKRKQRTSWLDAWMRSDRVHKLEDARHSQKMLLLKDLFSLWLCCEAPIATPAASILENSSMKLQTDVLFEWFRFAPQPAEVEIGAGGRLDRLNWKVAVAPYPLVDQPLATSAPAIAAPARAYASWPEFQAASWPVELRWQLSDGESTAVSDLERSC